MKREKYFNYLLETTEDVYYEVHKGRFIPLQGCPVDFEEYLNDMNFVNQERNEQLYYFYED